MKRTQEKIAQAVQSYLETGDASDLVALPARIENRIKRCCNASLWELAANSSVLSVEVSGGVLDLDPELRNLLLPIAALQEYGTSEEIAASIDVLNKAIGIAKDFPDREQTVSDLEEMSAYLEMRKAAMATAEKILDDVDWKFDPKTRKAKRIEKRDAEGFFAACVRAAYKAKRMKRGNSTLVREKIAKTLAPWFDDEELSSESGGPIYMAIYKMENAPR